mgnify:CR=1 FL=1
MSYNTCIKISEDRYKKFEDRAEETQDKLSNLFAIYSSGNVKEEIKNYEKINTSYRRSYTKSILCSSKIKFVNNLLIDSDGTKENESTKETKELRGNMRISTRTF